MQAANVRILAVLFAFAYLPTTAAAIESPGDQAAERVLGVWRAENCCGLNCLYALLRCQGIAADYATIEKRLMDKGSTPSLADLAEQARNCGLNLSVGKTGTAGLSQLAKPVIVHVEQFSPRGNNVGHFVLVLATMDDRVTYFDGTTAETTDVPWSEFEGMWSGYVAYSPTSRTGTTVTMLTAGGLLAIACRWVGRRWPRRLFRAARAVLAASMALVGDATFAQETSPEVAAVTAAYERTYGELQNFSYKYTCTRRAKVAVEVLARLNYYKPRQTATTSGEVVATLDRFRLKRINPVEKGEDATGVTEIAFNGEVFTERQGVNLTTRGATRSGVGISDRTSDSYNFRELLPLDGVLLTFDVPSAPRVSETRSRYLWPSVAKRFELRPAGTEECDGSPCLVFSSNDLKLWLDPQLNYAVRRRAALYEGKVIYDERASDHFQVCAGVWVPKRLIKTTLGNMLESPEYSEQPLFEDEYKITEFRRNIPLADTMFRLDAKPGEWVVDQTLAPHDADGKLVRDPQRPGVVPAVSYVQPADKSRVDAAIARAMQRPAGQGGKLSVGAILMIVNAVIVLLLGLLLSVRWWLRRSGSW